MLEQILCQKFKKGKKEQLVLVGSLNPGQEWQTPPLTMITTTYKGIHKMYLPYIEKTIA